MKNGIGRQIRTRNLLARAPYWRKRWRARWSNAIKGVIGRYVLSPRQRRQEKGAAARFLGAGRQFSFTREALFDLAYFRDRDGRKFEDWQTAYECYVAECERGELLQTHPLFDPVYYREQVGDFEGLTPIDHFLEKQPDVSPSPFFDHDYYLQKNGDVRQVGRNSFVHFFCHGRGELRAPHPLFSPQFVLSAVMDLGEEIVFECPLSAYLKLRPSHPKLRPHPLIVPGYIRRQTSDPAKGDPLLTYVRGESDDMRPHPHFDPRYYQSAVRLAGLEPPLEGETWLAHYLRTVPSEALLDPSASFSSVFYAKTHPDIGNMNPLLHFEQYGRGEKRATSVARPRSDDENISSIVAIEPTIFQAHQQRDIDALWGTVEPRRLRPGVRLIEELSKEIGSFRPTHVILLSAFRRGGAERINLKLADALLEDDPDARILFLATDPVDDEARHWFRPGERLRAASFAHEPELPRDLAIVLLTRFLTMLRPQMVLNCNSGVGWDAYREFGRGLSDIMKLRASLFCYDHDQYGNKVGYARDYIRDTIDYLDLCYADNRCFAEQLATDFSLSRRDRSKIITLYQYLEDGSWRAPEAWPNLSANAKTPAVLWPMRFHRQKRPDILRQVAEALPEVRFDVWVPGGRWNNRVAGGGKPHNVVMVEDRGQAFDELDVAGYIAMLSTSEWEGLPTITLEASAVGLPIVASDVGGVSELVAEDGGYLVRPFDDVEGYARAIRQIIADPQKAHERRVSAIRHAQKQHGRTAFRKALTKFGFLTTPPDASRRSRNTRQDPAAASHGGGKTTRKPRAATAPKKRDAARSQRSRRRPPTAPVSDGGPGHA